MEWDDHLERIHSNGSHRRQTSLGHDLVIRMNLDEAIKALGPRPQPRPGGASWRADAEWFARYLELFPKDGPDLMRRFRARQIKETTNG